MHKKERAREREREREIKNEKKTFESGHRVKYRK